MTPIVIDRNHTRFELLRLGFDDDAIGRACDDGQIERIGAGMYSPSRSYARSRESAHRERAVLWARQSRERGALPEQRALGVVSAAAVLGLPLWGPGRSAWSPTDDHRR